MNTRSLLIATAVALASGAALADDPTIDTTIYHRSNTTRAQVKADLHVAKALGQLLPAGEREAAPSVVPVYGLARSTVKAEVLTARAEGTLLAAGELIDGATHGRPATSLSITTLARR